MGQAIDNISDFEEEEEDDSEDDLNHFLQPGVNRRNVEEEESNNGWNSYETVVETHENEKYKKLHEGTKELKKVIRKLSYQTRMLTIDFCDFEMNLLELFPKTKEPKTSIYKKAIGTLYGYFKEDRWRKIYLFYSSLDIDYSKTSNRIPYIVLSEIIPKQKRLKRLRFTGYLMESADLPIGKLEDIPKSIESISSKYTFSKSHENKKKFFRSLPKLKVLKTDSFIEFGDYSKFEKIKVKVSSKEEFSKVLNETPKLRCLSIKVREKVDLDFQNIMKPDYTNTEHYGNTSSFDNEKCHYENLVAFTIHGLVSVLHGKYKFNDSDLCCLLDNCPNLKLIKLKRTSVTQNGFVEVVKRNKIEKFSMKAEWEPFKDFSEKLLNGDEINTNLKSLNVMVCGEYHLNFFAYISTKLSKLEKLSVDTRVDDKGKINDITSLKVLKIRGVYKYLNQNQSIEDLRGLMPMKENIEVINKLLHLRYLSFEGYYDPYSTGLFEILKMIHPKKLYYLHLCKNFQVDDKMMEYIQKETCIQEVYDEDKFFWKRDSK